MSYIIFETPQLLTTGGEPALFLLDMALKATAIILAAIALNIALRRASAATRHLLWSASLLGLLALPFLAYLLPNWRVAVLPESFSISRTLQPPSNLKPYRGRWLSQSRRGQQSGIEHEPAARLAATSEKHDRARHGIKPLCPHNTLEASRRGGAPPTRTFHWGQWVLMIWLAGFLVSIGRLLIGIATLWRLSRRAKEITDANWTALACDISRELGLPGGSRCSRALESRCRRPGGRSDRRSSCPQTQTTGQSSAGAWS